MQVESLKVFCDLAETESFTKAAQINNVTQSAVSQQISSLERQFKSLLIERSKKKFRLTREGQVLYEYSKQIIQSYDSLHNRLQEIKDIISGTIRVATIYSIGLHDLPALPEKIPQALSHRQCPCRIPPGQPGLRGRVEQRGGLGPGRLSDQGPQAGVDPVAQGRRWCSSAIRSIRWPRTSPSN